jgi:hypothetical protein
MRRNAADTAGELLHWLTFPFLVAACLLAYLIIAIAKPLQHHGKVSVVTPPRSA